MAEAEEDVQIAQQVTESEAMKELQSVMESLSVQTNNKAETATILRVIPPQLSHLHRVLAL